MICTTVSSATLFRSRLNPKMKLSAEFSMLHEFLTSGKIPTGETPLSLLMHYLSSKRTINRNSQTKEELRKVTSALTILEARMRLAEILGIRVPSKPGPTLERVDALIRDIARAQQREIFKETQHLQTEGSRLAAVFLI